jgi:hypothetical protein
LRWRWRWPHQASPADPGLPSDDVGRPTCADPGPPCPGSGASGVGRERRRNCR